MMIQLTRENGKLTLALEGRLDTITAPELEALLKKQLPLTDELVIDMEKLEYLSSVGLRVLLYAHQTLEGRGTMVIRNANELVREVFDVTGFSDILTIE